MAALDDNDLLRNGSLPDDPAAGAGLRSAAARTEPGGDWEEPIPLLAVPEPAQFPLMALPTNLRRFVQCAAEAVQVPVDLPALAALGVLAAAAGNRIAVRARRDYLEFLNLYLLIALASGERKSSLLAILRSPVERFESACRERWSPEVERANRQRLLLERQRDALLRASTQEKRGSEAESLEEGLARLEGGIRQIGTPTVPRVLLENVTPEALCLLLARHHGQIAAIDSDMDLKTMMGIRYGGRAGQNISLLLKAYSGEELRVDRIGREPLFVPRPILTLCLAVQPHVMAHLLSNEEVLDRGLAARFLYSAPSGSAGYRRVLPPPDPIPQPVMGAFDRTVTQLLEFSRPGLNMKDAPTPPALTLSMAARDAYLEHAAAIERELRPSGRLGASSLKGWGCRQTAHALKIAGLLHLASCDDVRSALAAPLDLQAMAAAIEICEYSENHARIAFGTSGFDKVTRFAVHVLARLPEIWKPGVTVSWLFDKLRGGDFDTMDSFLPVLLKLEQHGFIRVLAARPPGSKGGRPGSPMVDLHPSFREPGRP